MLLHVQLRPGDGHLAEALGVPEEESLSQAKTVVLKRSEQACGILERSQLCHLLT